MPTFLQFMEEEALELPMLTHYYLINFFLFLSCHFQPYKWKVKWMGTVTLKSQPLSFKASQKCWGLGFWKREVSREPFVLKLARG